MKIYITGISGMLGDALYNNLKKSHQVSGCDLVKVDHEIDILDLTDSEAVETKFESIEFEILIHTAAYINVDGCEQDPQLAYKLNAEVTKVLSLICKKKKAKMIYISTDAVFSGNKEGSYSENDKTDPINVYGESKLLGEKFIKENLDDYLILRTNIYGWNKQNKQGFAEWVINSYKKNEAFNMFYDVLYTPIYVGNFAEALEEIIRKEFKGLYNLVGSESCSKYDFGVGLGRIFGYDTSIVNRTSVNTYNFKAKRSTNMRLDNSKLQNNIVTQLLSVDDGIIAFYKDMDK